MVLKLSLDDERLFLPSAWFHWGQWSFSPTCVVIWLVKTTWGRQKENIWSSVQFDWIAWKMRINSLPSLSKFSGHWIHHHNHSITVNISHYIIIQVTSFSEDMWWAWTGKTKYADLVLKKPFVLLSRLEWVLVANILVKNITFFDKLLNCWASTIFKSSQLISRSDGSSLA